jgi:hypothetical protein
MKAIVEIICLNDLYYGMIDIQCDLLAGRKISTTKTPYKGQLKRQLIQFCGALNLEMEWKNCELTFAEGDGEGI